MICNNTKVIHNNMTMMQRRVLRLACGHFMITISQANSSARNWSTASLKHHNWQFERTVSFYKHLFKMPIDLLACQPTAYRPLKWSHLCEPMKLVCWLLTAAGKLCNTRDLGVFKYFECLLNIVQPMPSSARLALLDKWALF